MRRGEVRRLQDEDLPPHAGLPEDTE